MTTERAVRAILKKVSDGALIVASLGRTAEELFRQARNPDRILFLDGLGAAAGVGTGVALGCPDTSVFSFDTDGSFMYNITILNTIAAEREHLNNFRLIIMDNEILESAGGFASASVRLDWESLANAWGLPLRIVTDEAALKHILENDVAAMSFEMLIVKVQNKAGSEKCTKDIDGIESKYRFKRFVNDNINGNIIRPCIKN